MCIAEKNYFWFFYSFTGIVAKKMSAINTWKYAKNPQIVHC